MVGKFDRASWPWVEIIVLWMLVHVVRPFEMFMTLGREIWQEIYADILKQIFFVMASKMFFRLWISRTAISKKVIAADGLLELLAKGKHKLFTNYYELFTVSFVWYLASNHVAIIKQSFFVLYVFLKTSVLV